MKKNRPDESHTLRYILMILLIGFMVTANNARLMRIEKLLNSGITYSTPIPEKELSQ